MSGKSKQRTKGNVKPSSSGRAAALISKDGTVGFVGFGLMGSPGASNLGYVPMTAGSAEDVDASVDSEFRMVMRKLMKRDAVTKLKAIQEFTDLCKNSTVAAVESALPFWPRLFNKLSMDVDHRVREATQQAMEQLVLRVGRNLAPHLRYVIGPWLCSQFDTYAVVASSGRKSFQAAFSDEKQAEVIMFCRKELFEFLQDNILTQTPSTLSDPKFVSEEEREAKYNRVLSSSILALGKLISVTSEKAREEMEELYLSLLREKKFWKYTKHKSPNVRGAVFSTVSIACEMRPSLMLSLSCHVSPAVLSALDDSDPAVCQHLWNAVLSVVKNIADCWKQVNVRKAVLPKLWSVLKNGGSGCASIIFPNLLPFLSKVPSEVVGSGLGFYQELFSNLQEGLSKERVQNSLSECSAVVLAFMECLQFCLLHEFGGEGPHETVQEYLIKEQLLVLMKSSLEKQSSKMMQSSVYTHASDLLSFLSIKCEVHNKTVEDSESDGQKDSQPFSRMLKWFWDGLSFLCMKYVQSTSHKVDMEYISSVSHCLITLKSPTTRNKKQHKVAFIESLPEHLNSIPSDTGSVLSSEKCYAVTDTQTEPVDVENLYNGCLLDLVCNVCNLCIDEIIQMNSLMHLSLLSWLVPNFTSEQLIKTLNKTSEHTSRSVSVDGNNYCELSEQFISQTLFPWMTLSCGQLFPGDQSNHELSGAFTDSKSVEYVITIFCGIVRILPVEKQEELVSRALQQNTAVSFLYKLVHQGILSDIAGVVRWIQCPNGNEKLLGLSSRVVLRIEQNTSNDSSALLEDDRKTIWKLLKLCLVGARTVLMLEKNFVEKLFQHFLRILRQSEIQSGEELLILLDILTTFLNNCERNPADLVPSTQDLLLAVFQLQLTDTNHVSTTVSQAVTETWQTGLKVCRLFPIEVDSTPCQTLLLKAATVVQDKLMKMDTLESVENIVIKAVCLLKDASLVNAGNDSADETLTQKVLNALTPKERELNFFRNGYSLSQWLLPPVLERNLPIMSAVYDQLDESQSTTATLNSHQKMILFFSSLTKEILSDSDESFSGRSVMVARESLVGLWLEMSWVRHWCSCVLGSSCSTEEFSPNICDQAIYNLLLKLQKTSNYLLEHIKNKDWCGALLVDALTRSRTEGFLWCLVLEGVLQDLQQLGVSFDPALLLAEVQSSASLEEKECQTLNTLLSHVNGIYELKVVTERFTSLLCEVTDESGFARLFSIICGSLQQWFRQTEGSEEALLECQLTAAGILDELVEWNKTHENLLLINSSLDDTVSMSVLTVNLSLIRILQMAVLQCPDKMNSKHWDFLLCSLAGWLQTCEENRSNLTSSLKCVALCCQVCSLFCTAARFFEENASKLTKISLEGQSGVASHEAESTSFENTSRMTGDVAEFPPNLCAEWQEFFSGTLFTAVLQLFLFHAAECQSAHFEASPWSTRISNSLGLSVAYTPVALLREHKFEGPPYGDARASLNVPRWIEDLMGHCSPLLKCSAHGLQFAAYYLLAKVMADISVVDDKVAESEQTEEEPVRSPPTPLIKLINSTCGHMMEMMGDAQVPFGEHLDMTGDTEAQSVSLALMLAWKLLLQLFRELPQEKRVEYAKYIRQNKMVDNLLGVLFRLIPLKSPGIVVSDDCEPVIGRFAGQRTIQVLASDVCYCLMQWMPAIVRQWWNSLDKRQSAIVDKFTISSITPQLCQREMQMVQNSSVRFDNMQVKTRPSAREVAAVYTVEEMSMELVVKLAPNHPLGVVSVDSGRKIGVAAAQWRSWMLQMTTFLTHQNGSIMDGLILWKRNVDKRFEGVDDCMICFSVIHGSNYSLPKLSCKTCKKKFHSACLYKWFSTSNNATCPLCRNLF